MDNTENLLNKVYLLTDIYFSTSEGHLVIGSNLKDFIPYYYPNNPRKGIMRGIAEVVLTNYSFELVEYLNGNTEVFITGFKE